MGEDPVGLERWNIVSRQKALSVPIDARCRVRIWRNDKTCEKNPFEVSLIGRFCSVPRGLAALVRASPRFNRRGLVCDRIKHGRLAGKSKRSFPKETLPHSGRRVNVLVGLFGREVEPLLDFREARFNGGEALTEHDVCQLGLFQFRVGALGEAVNAFSISVWPSRNASTSRSSSAIKSPFVEGAFGSKSAIRLLSRLYSRH